MAVLLSWPRVEWDSYQYRQVDSASSRIHHVLVKTSFSCSSVWKEKGEQVTSHKLNKYINCRNVRTFYIRTIFSSFRTNSSHNLLKHSLSKFMPSKQESDWDNVYENDTFTATSRWYKVSALVSGGRDPGSSPGRGYSVVFLGKTLYSHSVSPHPGV